MKSFSPHIVKKFVALSLVTILSGCHSMHAQDFSSLPSAENFNKQENQLLEAYSFTYVCDKCGFAAVGRLERNYISQLIYQCPQYEKDRDKMLVFIDAMNVSIPEHLRETSDKPEGSCDEPDSIQAQLKGIKEMIPELQSLVEKYQRGITCLN